MLLHWLYHWRLCMIFLSKRWLHLLSFHAMSWFWLLHKSLLIRTLLYFRVFVCTMFRPGKHCRYYECLYQIFLLLFLVIRYIRFIHDRLSNGLRYIGFFVLRPRLNSSLWIRNSYINRFDPTTATFLHGDNRSRNSHTKVCFMIVTIMIILLRCCGDLMRYLVRYSKWTHEVHIWSGSIIGSLHISCIRTLMLIRDLWLRFRNEIHWLCYQALNWTAFLEAATGVWLVLAVTALRWDRGLECVYSLEFNALSGGITKG